jgi:3-dehydroquinate synthase
MKKITVSLKDNKYDILISQNQNKFLSALKKAIKTNTFFIITDNNVKKIHLNFILKLLKKQGYNVKIAVINAGESEKNIKNLSFLYDKALKERIDRKSCVIALGGGVVGDIAGFFAATFMRGISFIQIPTTLLAMTDSSIGGKTAINTAKGKNIAGVFYQPKLVWINVHFLTTLPIQHLKNGLAEVIKYALVFDKKFYTHIKSELTNGFLKDFDYLIYKCCFYKSQIVKKDEKEISRLRIILNFGHTFAHALETYSAYKKFLHGEAVAIGMLFASLVSLKLKLCSKKTFKEVKQILNLAGFKLHVKINIKQFLNLMKNDKKTISGNINLILISEIGKTKNILVKDNIILNVLKNFSGAKK